MSSSIAVELSMKTCTGKLESGTFGFIYSLPAGWIVLDRMLWQTTTWMARGMLPHQKTYKCYAEVLALWLSYLLLRRTLPITAEC